MTKPCKIKKMGKNNFVGTNIYFFTLQRFGGPSFHFEDNLCLSFVWSNMKVKQKFLKALYNFFHVVKPSDSLEFLFHLILEGSFNSRNQDFFNIIIFEGRRKEGR